MRFGLAVGTEDVATSTSRQRYQVGSENPGKLIRCNCYGHRLINSIELQQLPLTDGPK